MLTECLATHLIVHTAKTSQGFVSMSGGCSAVSFSLDGDVLSTANSSSEELVGGPADMPPLSEQETHPALAYTELFDVISSAADKLKLH